MSLAGLKVFLNNAIVPIEKARISVLDHGFLYGDGVFETMRVYDGAVFRLSGHLARLRQSASLISLSLPYSDEALTGFVLATLAANGLKEALLRITLSRGPGPTGLDMDLCPAPTLFILAQPFTPYPVSFYEQGIALVISQVRKNLREAINPKIKSLNFLNNILAKHEAKQAQAQEALMVNHEGFLAECTVSNVFFVTQGVLHTPSLDCGILEGITRSIIIELAQKHSITVKEGRYLPKDIYHAEEVFITNTTMEVMPVTRVDEVAFRVGQATALLGSAFARQRGSLAG